MSDIKKFLDYEGVQHLWSKINMNDYPNNAILMEVINAIDETKADVEHSHAVDDIVGLQDAVNAAADKKFYVVTFDQGDDGEYHGDLTFAEIREKFEAGGNMVARIDGTDYIPLLSAAPHQIIFSGIYQSQSVALTITANDVCTLSSTALARSSHTHPTASSSASGFMSEEDKIKLKGIEAGAEVNVIESITVNGEEVTVTDKAVNIEIPEQTQSDWNQNDEAAVDYIKNKPFYDNTEVLLDTITVNNGDELELNIEKDIGMQGDIITVVWDGISSEKIIDHFKLKEDGAWNDHLTIGNRSYANDSSITFDDTGEEYLIKNRMGYDTSTIICDDQSHTLSIVKGTLVQIDEKFIPGTIARVSDVDEKIDEAIANIPESTASEVKMPITLGAFRYFKWGELPGSTVEEKASHLAKYDVIVYQDSLCNDLEMNDAGYERDLALYKKALEYNPNLKVFGYVTARGFANRNGGGHVGMTEYRTSPSNVDHPIWTKEELCAYIKLMAHCGGTIDASKTDEYGNKEITGGIPLYGVFFDDYDYNFEDDNAHLMNQGDWATIREKHNFLIDYCHSQGLHVMPNSSPDLIFGNEATPNSIRNPDGVPSHMSEGDWFCCESYFLRSDYTFSLTDSHMPTFTNKYKDEYKCKSLALAYVYAVSDDAEDNEQIASTFAIYQALCHGVDSIALHGSSLFTEIPEEFSKYYDINNNAVYSTGSGYATLKVNGHTITASRSVNATQYGMEPNSHALSTCLVNVDGHVFNNIYVRNEELEYKFKDLKGNVNTKIDELTTKVEQTSNLYHRAFIDDWEKNYTLDDYTNYAFTFENAFGGEDTGATSSWSSFAPYDFTVNLPAQWSWRRVLMDASHLAGKTVELGFETSDAYLSTSVTTKVNPVWQIVGVCESNSNLNITTLNVKATQKSQVDGVTRCCVRFTMPEDISQLMFWTQRTEASPSGTWTIDVTGTYLVDLNEYQKQKTWFTNYAPDAASWGMMHSGYYSLTYGEDSFKVNYTKTSNCYEARMQFPVNTAIFKPGETWELGLKDIRMTQPDTGADVTSKIIILFNLGNALGVNLSIGNKTYSQYKAMKSEVENGRIALARFTIPEGYTGGMPATPMYIYPTGYVGGDSNGLYQLYVEGLYLYKLDERDELVVRGEDPSDTLIGLNRVRTDTIDSKLAPDTLYIVDDGSMFITDFRGTRVDINGGEDGTTPHIGENGNWFIGETDTGVSAGGSSVQTDWSQDDETASDYIKNKPFYDNTDTLLDTITVNNGDTLDFAIDADIGAEGDVVTVIWDGAPSEKAIGYCEVRSGRWGFVRYTIGNQSYFNNDENTFDDTGESYVIYSAEGDTTSTVVCDGNPHTLSIVRGELVRIEDKFISDKIARKSQVDSITPHIEKDGNWFIGDTDTGLKASDVYHRAFYDEWENPNAKRTWYTNYAPPMTEWKFLMTDWGVGGTNENIAFTFDEDGDGVTIDYLSADSSETVAEFGLEISANSDILQLGETWEVGVKEFYAYDDDGNDVTNKCQIYFKTNSQLGFNYYNKDASFYSNSVSQLHPSLRAMKQNRISSSMIGMPESKLIVKAIDFVGGTVREDGTPNYYHIRVKGFYIYNVAEREELTLRGVDLPDTYIKINRVTPDTIKDTIEPDSLYIVDDGSMFATNFKGERVDLCGVYTQLIMRSSTKGSSKKFKLTIDDDGKISTEKVSE